MIEQTLDEWGKIESEICLVADETAKKAITGDFLFYRALVCNYHEWKLSGDKNFADWGAKNGRQVCSNVKAYYYTK